MLKIDYITNSIFNSRTYILSNGSDKVWLVDCGDAFWNENDGSTGSPTNENWLLGSRVEGVLLTHTHSDHIYGLQKLLEIFPNALVYTNAFGYEALASPKLNISKYHSEYPDIIIEDRRNVRLLEEGTKMYLLGEKVNVFETPGHDPSCLTYKIAGNLFTGDSFIPGVKVVTSFPNSDKDKAKKSEAVIKSMRNVIIQPGHDISKIDK